MSFCKNKNTHTENWDSKYIQFRSAIQVAVWNLLLRLLWNNYIKFPLSSVFHQCHHLDIISLIGYAEISVLRFSLLKFYFSIYAYLVLLEISLYFLHFILLVQSSACSRYLKVKISQIIGKGPKYTLGMETKYVKFLLIFYCLDSES